MTRKAVSAFLVLGSIALSLFALGPLFYDWAQVLPSDAAFDVDDRASIEQAIIHAASDARETMREAFAPWLFSLAGALVLAASALAFHLNKGSPLVDRRDPETVPPNTPLHPTAGCGDRR